MVQRIYHLHILMIPSFFWMNRGNFFNLTGPEEAFCLHVCQKIYFHFNRHLDKFPAGISSLSDLKKVLLNYDDFEIQKNSLNKVLLFPPLNPRGRYLIHTCAGFFDHLKSKSIGKDNGNVNKRRVTIFLVASYFKTNKCHKSELGSCMKSNKGKSESHNKRENNSKHIMSSPRWDIFLFLFLYRY